QDERLLVDQADERREAQVRRHDEAAADRSRDEMATPGEHPDRGGAPEGRRGVEAADVDALMQDDAGAEKADAGDDLRGDAAEPIAGRLQPGKGDEACR